MSNRSSDEKVFRRAPMEIREAVQRALWTLQWHPKPVGSDGFTAVWTSRVFRFKDDVTVDLLPEKGATRVRVQSTSRVGHYDFGQNARHVRQLFEALEKELGS